MLPFCSENCVPFQLRHAHVIKETGLSPHIHVPAWERLDTKTVNVLFSTVHLCRLGPHTQDLERLLP